MVYCRQVNHSLPFSFFWILLAGLLFFSSCIVPKNYQAGKPFVFQTNIDVRGPELKLGQRQEMETRLFNQLDDSLKVKIKTFLIVRQTLVSPAVFDTAYVSNSIGYMNSLMYTMGYFHPVITWDTTLKKVKKQERVTVNFLVKPGRFLKLDSVNYVFTDPHLQHLADSSRGDALLKKGDTYTLQSVASELDRLINMYKENGYYKISRDDFYAEHDTVIAALIDPSLDPFEQLRLLEELRRRKENPTINVVFKQRTKAESHLTQYDIGAVSIYPDRRLFEDTSQLIFDSTRIRRITIFSKENLFKPRFLARNTSLIPGRLYQQSDYYHTINRFSQLGAWEQVNVELNPNDSTAKLDVKINLYPAKKQSLTIDLEATRSSADVIATSNLFGIGFIVSLRNRNLGKESIQSTTNIRAGAEFGRQKELLQTLQASFEKNLYFARFLLPFRFPAERRFTSARTVAKLNASFVNRRDYFRLRSLNGSFGYEATMRNTSVTFTPVNVQLLGLDIKQKLEQLFIDIPNLRFSFQDGLILSQSLVVRSVATRPSRINTLKTNSVAIGIESSGAVLGLIKSIDQQGKLFRYIKMDFDFRHTLAMKKSALAFRAYAGYGLPYGLQKGGAKETSLPFVKSFFAGGPYSMRGWQVRRLGPGSSDTLKEYDRFGDIALEGNAEFRFNIATVGSVKLKSAVFVDVGNIWNRTDFGDPKLVNTDFNFSRLDQDLAVAAGTSIRFDFDYFLIRFDWAYKVKDPAFYEINNGWFHDMKIGNGLLQLGIGYPF